MSSVQQSVLLVDDDPEIVWVLGRYFTRSGFAVTTCGDGEEAISLFRKKRYDFVITDIRMPRVNGLELVDWLRENRPGVRVAVMTGFGGPSIRELSIKKGAILYLEKPVDPEFLMEVLVSSEGEESFTGTIDQIDILDYLQLMMLSGRQTVLEVLSKDLKRGLVYIDKGEVRHAICGELRGEEALYHCVCFRGGSFMNRPWTEPETVTINRPGEFLLMEAARHRDEMRGDYEGD